MNYTFEIIIESKKEK